MKKKLVSFVTIAVLVLLLGLPQISSAAGLQMFGGSGAKVVKILLDTTASTGVLLEAVSDSATYWRFFDSGLADADENRIISTLLTARSLDAPVGIYVNGSGKVVGAALLQ